MANCLGAPPILACLVSSNDRLTKASRQGWAALPGGLSYLYLRNICVLESLLITVGFG